MNTQQLANDLEYIKNGELATQARNDEVEELKSSPIMDQAMRQAQKYLRKNKAEWKRLHKHAESALFSNNKTQYVYAIKKMRKMLKQPYTDEIGDIMWRTSRESLKQVVIEAYKNQPVAA